MTSLLDRASRVLAGGPGTFSKHPSKYAQGIGPDALVAGEGCWVTGSDGTAYLDTVAALGPMLLGYGHPEVTKAVMRQVKTGGSFSMLHPLEVECAELLVSIMPQMEMVRWMRNGSDGTGAAIRLARAITGKRHVICCGYHGASSNDWYAITTDRAEGVLSLNAGYSHQIPFGDFSGVPVHVWDDLAAIIVEPPPFRWESAIEADALKLGEFGSIAHAHGAFFILDEVITMLRYGLGGATAMYGLDPDLITGGKALANGLPLAVLGGKREYMSYFDTGRVFTSYTFAGETTALAACKAVIETLRDTPALENLQKQGDAIGNGLQTLFRQYGLPVEVWGNYARIAVKWQRTVQATTEQLRTLWIQEHARHGVLVGYGVIFPMAVWSAHDTQHFLTTAQDACQVIRESLDTGTMDESLQCPIIYNSSAIRHA